MEESWAGSPSYEPRVSLQPTVRPWAAHLSSLSLIVTFIEPCGFIGVKPGVTSDLSDDLESAFSPTSVTMVSKQ